MTDLRFLRALARARGVLTRYRDGRGRRVVVPAETLRRALTAIGTPAATDTEVMTAIEGLRQARTAWHLPPVLVAWEGHLPPVVAPAPQAVEAAVQLEDGAVIRAEPAGGWLHVRVPLPIGCHQLTVSWGHETVVATVIAAPVEAWRRPGAPRSWGVATHLAALRTRRSRAVADLRDLEVTCDTIARQGGDLVTVLPLLPTFNTPPAEPSPYAPVSRLFWSELILDLGPAHQAVPGAALLDVAAADAEVRAALAGRLDDVDPASAGDELARYARFRGAQAHLGRDWRSWPAAARSGTLEGDQVDRDEERFHLLAQRGASTQLGAVVNRLEERGMRLGLDLAVGVHPDGYDAWSRPGLFGEGLSVGAPPDEGFPSGQDWGFPPVLPDRSRQEGHRYLAACIAHQARMAGVLRIDHVMGLARLYCIPRGLGLHEGTYLTYPAEELFALVTLESHRHRCEIVGENLGTVPPQVAEALPRHRIWGMYVAQFQAHDGPAVPAPTGAEMAMIGTHDTPTLAGWLGGADIAERVVHGLLPAEEAGAVREVRACAAQWLAERLGGAVSDPADLLERLLDWLGRSDAPLVVPWLEDLWLEPAGVNLPGTRSSERPNWQRPLREPVEDLLGKPQVERRLRVLAAARSAAVVAPAPDS